MNQEPTPTFMAAASFLGIKIEPQWIDQRAFNNSTDKIECDHWIVRLKSPLSSVRVEYSKGLGHNGKKPHLSEILESLFMDNNLSKMDFESFSSEFYGDIHTLDSNTIRYAKKSWKACKKNDSMLKRLFGPLYLAASEEEGAIALFDAAWELCKQKPKLAKPDKQKEKWGLLSLAAFSAEQTHIIDVASLGHLTKNEPAALEELCDASIVFSSDADDTLRRDAAKAAVRAISEAQSLQEINPKARLRKRNIRNTL